MLMSGNNDRLLFPLEQYRLVLVYVYIWHHGTKYRSTIY
jgi:hypothetical protein